MLSVNARWWALLAALAVFVGAAFAFADTRQSSKGFILTGRLTATETERTERYVNFGKAFAWVINDATLWAELRPLIGEEIVIVVEPK